MKNIPVNNVPSLHEEINIPRPFPIVIHYIREPQHLPRIWQVPVQVTHGHYVTGIWLPLSTISLHEVVERLGDRVHVRWTWRRICSFRHGLRRPSMNRPKLFL